MRLHIAENGLYTYPDVMLVCEPLKFVEGRRDTITNPVIIVEVISESTANYDRGLKAKRYRALESLQFYIIIEQGQVSVELRQKVSEGDWLLTGYDSLNDTFSIPGLGFELTLSEIYDQVDFVEELK
jgi:Uma2 family endonuclease